jgi:hypothetical protein
VVLFLATKPLTCAHINSIELSWDFSEQASIDFQTTQERQHYYDRCNYLRKIKSFRETGYDIVYMDETWVNQNHCTDYMWLPNDRSDAPRILKKDNTIHLLVMVTIL